MIYEYKCKDCGYKFEVVKSVKDIENVEKCPECDSEETSIVISAKIYHTGAKVKDAHYDPALGTVIKSEAHKKEHLKQNDLIEVGTEKSKESFHNNVVVKKQKEREDEWRNL